MLPGHEAIVPEIPKAVAERALPGDVTDHEVDDDAVIAKAMNPNVNGLAPQAAVLDRDDSLGL
jgi:hypothetical protein